MFSINNDLKINRTEINQSFVFEIFDVFKDPDWALEYMEGRPSSTRFNIKKHADIAKEYTVSIVDRHIKKFQEKLSLLCEQTVKEEGLFNVNYIKVSRKFPSFTQQLTHTGYIGVVYFSQEEDDYDGRKINCDIALHEKTGNTIYNIQPLHNKMVLFNGNKFNIQNTFKTKDVTHTEFYTCVMYFG